ncbi:MAG: hypothetical protein ACOC7U_04905, partial [Spirochaetota bacterium]
AWSVHQLVISKPAAAFSSEHPGETGACRQIEKFFVFFGLDKTTDGVTAGGAPGNEDLEACRELGRRLAEAAT